jgi:transposase
MLIDLNSETPPPEGSKSGQNRSGHLPRHRYPLEFKLKVLNETFEPGASVAAVALRHKMNTNVVFRWRKEFREGRLDGLKGLDLKNLVPAFAPVHIVSDAAAMPPPPVPDASAQTKVESPQPRSRPGIMHLTVPGGFTLRIEGDVDDAALRRVIRAVRDVA